MSAAVSPPWVTDLARLCDRLTDRLGSAGARHPGTAAAVLLARGERGLPASAWAVELGVSGTELAAAERGDLALVELPAPVLRAVRDLPRVELAHLVDLDTDAARARHPAAALAARRSG